jgi:hypothetical protein
MSLAAKLPYNHPFAGGYPSLGSQPLPGDSDALTYLSAVAAADGAGVEVSVAMSIDGFIRELKATPGLFDAIKASCILCGARTLSGALVPLAGTAPTNNNFVAADYNRETGLIGNGSTKYLSSNRNNNADPQDSSHLAVYASSAGSANSVFIASGAATAGHTNMVHGGTGVFFHRLRSASGSNDGNPIPSGFLGIARSVSTEYIARSGAANFTASVASDGLADSPLEVYRRNLAIQAEYSNARLAFYSIGESLDLEDLDDAVSALVTAIGAAI